MSKTTKVLIIVSLPCFFVFLGGCSFSREMSSDVEKALEGVTGKTAIDAQKRANESLAISKCKDLFRQEKALGKDFSSGPCLSSEIIPDWACDVAHNPREEVDNNPENQCSAFREGKAHHFVELDTEGNLIKTY